LFLAIYGSIVNKIKMLLLLFSLSLSLSLSLFFPFFLSVGEEGSFNYKRIRAHQIINMKIYLFTMFTHPFEKD
jgi:hypothetical protein